MKQKKSTGIIHANIPTPAGTFVALYSDKGLCQLDFPNRTQKTHATGEPLPVPKAAWHEQTARAVKAVLAGQAPADLPPLDLSSGSEFQQSVWKALLGIPCGETASYAEVARRIGRPKAVRAVGGACGANPIPVIVPCHRVLAAHGRLGGFSGGLDWKRLLLGAEVPNQGLLRKNFTEK